jgi:phosphatidylinositol alpha-mannosyltransferase
MLSPYDLTVPGGVQGQVVGLAATLRARGHEVVVLAPGAPRGARPDGVLALGRAVGVPANGSVAPVCLSPLAASRAVTEVRRHHADLVHLHEPLAPVLGYGPLLAGRRPLVGTFHRSGTSRSYRILAPVARRALRRLAAACAVSEAARRTVAPLVAGEIELVFNGIDLQRFPPRHPGPPPLVPTVLFLGRHEPRKGLAILLEAFVRLQAPARLWVAGAGPQTAVLMRRYPPTDRLCWLGAIDEDEKVARLAAADVLCAPSLGGESFGLVLLEALAAGAALVASDIDGYRQVAAGHARLVPPGDAGALADALAEALADARAGRGRSSAEAVAAARHHAAQWSMDALARRYVGIYERVLALSEPGFR